MDYDVIIVGAGPGGSTAAKYLSEQGVHVLLLDKAKFPRDKPCGGGLCEHVTEFDYLRQKLEDASCNLVKSICCGSTTASPSQKYVYSYSSRKPLFYNVLRSDFDYQLVRFAVDAGAELLEGCRVTKILTTQNKAEVQLADGRLFTCKIIVGAGGIHDVVGTYVRQKENLDRKWKKDLDLAVVEEFKVGEEFVNRVHGSERKAIIKLKWVRLSGYAWVFPKRDTINIGFGGTCEEMRKINIKQEFCRYLDFLKKEGYMPEGIESKKLKGGYLPGQGPLKKTYANRVILVGDSAGFVSPISGEGIYYAMDSGRIASITIMKALEKKDFSGHILKQYQNMWLNAWGKDLNVLRVFKIMFLKFPEKIQLYGVKDKKLKEIYIGIFNGAISPKKIIGAIFSRVLIDFLKYDILKIHL